MRWIREENTPCIGPLSWKRRNRPFPSKIYRLRSIRIVVRFQIDHVRSVSRVRVQTNCQFLEFCSDNFIDMSLIGKNLFSCQLNELCTAPYKFDTRQLLFDVGIFWRGEIARFCGDSLSMAQANEPRKEGMQDSRECGE